MVAKDIFSFATMTDGCEEANFMGFSQYIYENELTSENMYLPMILAKKSQFHFSFFKVDSQNPKFSLEYLLPTYLCDSNDSRDSCDSSDSSASSVSCDSNDSSDRSDTKICKKNCFPLLWQNSKTQIVTKLKTQIVTKLKKSNCDKTQNLKCCQKLKTQIVTKL